MAVHICRASITLRDGTKIYARDYGKKAFCFWVGKGKSNEEQAAGKLRVMTLDKPHKSN